VLDMEVCEGPFWRGERHGDGAVCMKMDVAGNCLGRLVPIISVPFVVAVRFFDCHFD